MKIKYLAANLWILRAHTSGTLQLVWTYSLGLRQPRLHVKSTSGLRVSAIEITQCAFSQECLRRKEKWCALWEDYLRPADSLEENLIVIESIILSVHPINNNSLNLLNHMASFAQTYRGESLKLNRWNWMDLGSGNWIWWTAFHL